jgi:hypothetical protein
VGEQQKFMSKKLSREKDCKKLATYRKEIEKRTEIMLLANLEFKSIVSVVATPMRQLGALK